MTAWCSQNNVNFQSIIERSEDTGVYLPIPLVQNVSIIQLPQITLVFFHIFFILWLVYKHCVTRVFKRIYQIFTSKWVKKGSWSWVNLLRNPYQSKLCPRTWVPIQSAFTDRHYFLQTKRAGSMRVRCAEIRKTVLCTSPKMIGQERVRRNAMRSTINSFRRWTKRRCRKFLLRLESFYLSAKTPNNCV